MRGSKQHYLPACLIGGFGVVDKGNSLRQATVAVRLKETGKVFIDKAENLAYGKDTYSLKNPLAGVCPDAIDKLWGLIESELPELINRLESQCLKIEDDERLFFYVATATVRHPKTFEATAKNHNSLNGFEVQHGDYLQIQRLEALQNQFRQVSTWRWRVLHSSDDAPRFMITDRGWAHIGEKGRSSNGLLLPMSPRVAILGYLDEDWLPPRRSPFEEHLYLHNSAIDWINSCACTNKDPYVSIIIAHPDDQERLVGNSILQYVPIDPSGPYQYRYSFGFFD